MKVLIAEDDNNIRTLSKIVLEKEGYEVKDFENGQLAWEELERYTPDLIMSDIEMPLMNGFEFMEKVNANPQFDHCIKVFLTSLKERENISRGLALDVHDYITKPFTPGELRLRLRSIIDRNSLTE